MRIKVRDGRYDPDSDVEPSGELLWEGGDDELPAAVLAGMSCDFEPGTWYLFDDFEKIIGLMVPVQREFEVTGSVSAEQYGVNRRWQAAIEVSQTKAALMVCKAVLEHAGRLRNSQEIWVRVD